jgi:hypothetical protein
MTRGVPHPPELRAEVIAAVMAGSTISETALQFGLDKGLVSRWVAAEPLHGVATQKIPDFDLESLIRRYLDVGFRAMISQAEVMCDPSYSRAQDADKLAIAHGVLGDKLAGVAATAQALGFLGVPLEDPRDDPQLAAPYPPGADA